MPLTVGVPTETKTAESRVALTPDGVRELERHGIDVFIQSGAGNESALPDSDYVFAGATIVPTAQDAWAQQLVVKVKEPQGAELSYLRRDLTLVTYLHLAAYPEVGQALLRAGTTGIAYETVQLTNGALPLLAPMSEVAGRLAPQMGAQFLERHRGGRLLGRTQAGDRSGRFRRHHGARAGGCWAAAVSPRQPDDVCLGLCAASRRSRPLLP